MVIEFSGLILLGITFLYLGISTIYKYIKNISTNYKSEILNLFLFLSILFIISLTLFKLSSFPKLRFTSCKQIDKSSNTYLLSISLSNKFDSFSKTTTIFNFILPSSVT